MRLLVPALLVAWPLASSLEASVRLQRFVYEQLPRDVPPAAAALRREGAPDDGLIARKGAVAFYGGKRPVSFPRLSSLAQLAAHAETNRARYLYFSWYEGMLRPEFWYLLDTTATVPGLTRIASVILPPAVLYRIEPGFGRDPGWMADSIQPYVHAARGQIRALGDREAWDAFAFLGHHARLAGRWEEALGYFKAMTWGRPEDIRGWVYVGDAQVALGRLGPARAAYQRALQINPRSLGAGIGLGWTYYAEERWVEAAATWRPLLGSVTDVQRLEIMLDAFTLSGDSVSAARARKALASRGPRGGAIPLPPSSGDDPAPMD